MTVKFARFTAAEALVLNEIAIRARALLGYDRTAVVRDLSAVCHHTPLDLRRLLDAPTLGFMGELKAITADLDRQTGQLRGAFKLVYAKG